MGHPVLSIHSILPSSCGTMGSSSACRIRTGSRTEERLACMRPYFCLRSQLQLFLFCQFLNKLLFFETEFKLFKHRINGHQVTTNEINLALKFLNSCLITNSMFLFGTAQLGRYQNSWDMKYRVTIQLVIDISVKVAF